eukprot:Skav203485  [mRNA]  locus=scaffold3956:14383:19514:+ [translate_table: standard]
MLALKMAGTWAFHVAPGGGSLDSARSFVLDMLQRMEPLRDSDLQRLGERKRVDCRKRKAEAVEVHHGNGANGGHGLDAWDVSFYADLLKQEELHLDDEKLKEFFPLEGTIDRILEAALMGMIYTELLGLTFERNDQLPTWHEEVKAFEVKERGKARLHGRLGHVMHCLCTRTRFSMLSWAWPMVPWPGGVEQDFLEVPSMALEKFACEPLLLKRVARHFSGDGELEESVVSKIKQCLGRPLGPLDLGAREVDGGAGREPILCLAPPYSFDGRSELSVAELYRCVMQKYTTLAQLPKTNFSTSWRLVKVGVRRYFGIN